MSWSKKAREKLERKKSGRGRGGWQISPSSPHPSPTQACMTCASHHALYLSLSLHFSFVSCPLVYLTAGKASLTCILDTRETNTKPHQNMRLSSAAINNSRTKRRGRTPRKRKVEDPNAVHTIPSSGSPKLAASFSQVHQYLKKGQHSSSFCISSFYGIERLTPCS